MSLVGHVDHSLSDSWFLVIVCCFGFAPSVGLVVVFWGVLVCFLFASRVLLVCFSFSCLLLVCVLFASCLLPCWSFLVSCFVPSGVLGGVLFGVVLGLLG